MHNVPTTLNISQIDLWILIHHLLINEKPPWKTYVSISQMDIHRRTQQQIYSTYVLCDAKCVHLS